MVAQTLIYCVGAAKAGTSWLYEVLFKHPDCHFTALKELHYWNSLDLGRGNYYRTLLIQRLAEVKERHAAEPEGTALHSYQIGAIADIERWLATFDGKTPNHGGYLDFLGRGRAGARIIGDFTPAYAGLTRKGMKRMVGVFEKVKVIYLLREPVDRLWSHIRMDAGRGNAELAREKFDEFLKGGEQNVAMRSNYRQTINRLKDVVPEGCLHIEFYERLFTPEAIARLLAFLGIAPIEVPFGERYNASGHVSLDDDRRAAAQAVLAPQYNFIERFMGELPAEWTRKMVMA